MSAIKCKIWKFHVLVMQNGKEMYKKVWCTCKVIVFSSKPFFSCCHRVVGSWSPYWNLLNASSDHDWLSHSRISHSKGLQLATTRKWRCLNYLIIFYRNRSRKHHLIAVLEIRMYTNHMWCTDNFSFLLRNCLSERLIVRTLIAKPLV